MRNALVWNIAIQPRKSACMACRSSAKRKSDVGHAIVRGTILHGVALHRKCRTPAAAAGLHGAPQSNCASWSARSAAIQLRKLACMECPPTERARPAAKRADRLLLAANL